MKTLHTYIECKSSQSALHHFFVNGTITLNKKTLKTPQIYSQKQPNYSFLSKVRQTCLLN